MGRVTRVLLISVIVLRFKFGVARLKAAQGQNPYGQTGTLFQRLNTTSLYVPLVNQQAYFIRWTTPLENTAGVDLWGRKQWVKVHSSTNVLGYDHSCD